MAAGSAAGEVANWLLEKHLGAAQRYGACGPFGAGSRAGCQGGNAYHPFRRGERDGLRRTLRTASHVACFAGFRDLEQTRLWLWPSWAVYSGQRRLSRSDAISSDREHLAEHGDQFICTAQSPLPRA